MISGLWGKKIGMTQLFAGDKVVPVTAIDLSRWVVTNIKTNERDGYTALQAGCLRDRYAQDEFSADWLKKAKKYFSCLREIKTNVLDESIQIGQDLSPESVFAEGDAVDVSGKTRGKGFAGVVKRHNFAGGRRSHGSTMGERHPGSISWMRRQGRVIKGKRMAGHMGTVQRMMRNLPVVKLAQDERVIFVKGSIPGHAGSLVFIRKA